MTHLVFQPADAAILQKAMELDESLQGPVVEIKDDYAAGPLYSGDDAESWQQRRDWWNGLWEGSPYSVETLPMVDDKLTVHNLTKALDENPKEELWIWMGQNAHDVCGYYWLISQLQDYQGRVFVLYMNNLPFINEKGGIFYPAYLFEIPAPEFRKAKKLCRKVTLSELEVDPDEWKRLVSENALVRILEGGKKIASKAADFYDEDIVKNLSKEPQKGARALATILGKMKIKTSDLFLLWRMRVLAGRGELELNGDPAKGWKEFDVKLPGGAAAIVTEEAPAADGPGAGSEGS